MTAREFLRRAEAELSESGCPDPKVDSRRLLEGALNTTFAALRLSGDLPLNPDIEAQLLSRLARRVMGEPLQYIEGFQDFYGLRLKVDPRALIPRQDTETLAEAAIERIRSLPAPAVLDLCTGSGALALAMKNAVAGAVVTATDISEESLCLARENAARLGLEIEFLRGDLFSPVAGRRFDVIVSNPPYLSDADMSSLQREVAHEPRMALHGGRDGLEFYRRASLSLSGALKPGGVALFEVGDKQAKGVSEIFARRMPGADIAWIKDLIGVYRVVRIQHTNLKRNYYIGG